MRDGAGPGEQGQEDPDADHPSLDRAATWQVPSVGVQNEDAHHDAEPERQDDQREVLLAQSHRLGGEAGAKSAQDPDQGPGDAQV